MLTSRTRSVFPRNDAVGLPCGAQNVLAALRVSLLQLPGLRDIRLLASIAVSTAAVGVIILDPQGLGREVERNAMRDNMSRTFVAGRCR